MGCIYRAVCIVNGKSYVGFTTRSLEERKEEHRRYSGDLGCGWIFTRALRKYGWNSFVWEILFESSDAEILKKVEIQEIVFYGSKDPGGYNMTDGGEGTVGLRCTEEIKEKIRETLTGRTLTEEVRMKISDGVRKAMTGKKKAPFSEEHRRNMSKAHAGKKGVPHTEETKIRISAALIGKKKSIRSKEHRRKQSIAQTGKKKAPFSEEHRRNMSKAAKERWTRKRADKEQEVQKEAHTTGGQHDTETI